VFTAGVESFDAGTVAFGTAAVLFVVAGGATVVPVAEAREAVSATGAKCSERLVIWRSERLEGWLPNSWLSGHLLEAASPERARVAMMNAVDMHICISFSRIERVAELPK